MIATATRWLGVDVASIDANKLLRKLAALKTTKESTGPYAYAAYPAFSQIRIRTEKTAEDLDQWLWSVQHGADYVGVFDAEPPKHHRELQ